jgi:Ataxin-3
MAEAVWIYHERQASNLCGQHALNNLVQELRISATLVEPYFTLDLLMNVAHRLDDLEMQAYASANENAIFSRDYQARLAEGSGNMDATGNFSIQVLQEALAQVFPGAAPLQPLAVALQNAQKQRPHFDITDCPGFLLHKSDHWFVIRRVGGRFFNLNSTAERPVAISHFSLAKTLEEYQLPGKQQGYTVFAVTSGLPVGGSKPEHLPEAFAANFHLMADLLTGTSDTAAQKRKAAAGAATDWSKLKGKGLRLDGRSPMNGHHKVDPAAAPSLFADDFASLTEEEQLQLAMQASLVEPTVGANETLPPLRPEPAATEPDVVRIAFRWPDGQRTVRRFHGTESVGVLFTYVNERNQQQQAVLRYGFPPRDLTFPSNTTTLHGAGLHGETISVILR